MSATTRSTSTPTQAEQEPSRRHTMSWERRRPTILGPVAGIAGQPGLGDGPAPVLDHQLITVGETAQDLFSHRDPGP